MALTDPWDEHLETLTGGLGALTAGARSGRFRLHSAPGWSAEFRAGQRSITIGLQWAAPPAPRLTDYQLVLLYGLGFHAPGQPPHPVTFSKVLSLHEGYHWDEQTLREIVLETLGILRHCLGAAAEGAAIEDTSRPAGPLGFARSRAGRQRKRDG